jgi:prepilin signal peptidase PulO-like enzyme (type II secretory pathway)
VTDDGGRVTRARGGPARHELAATSAAVAVGVDVAAVATLGLMFAIEVPKGGPFIFGTANDALGAVHNVLLAPVVAQVSAELPPGPVRQVLVPVTLTSCAVGAASSALLVARVLPFPPSTALSIAAITVQSAWLLGVSGHLRARPMGRRAGDVARAIGIGTLAGGAVAAVGALLPRGSRARRVLLVAGGAPAAAAWVAWPAWFHLAARYLTTQNRAVR